MRYVDYPTELREIPVGVRFCMLNYASLHMKVELGYGIKGMCDGMCTIVNLETGRVVLMADIKPCRIWGG